MIYQEFNLVPDLGVIENIVLGVEPRRGIFLDRAAASSEASRVLGELGIVLPLDRPARRLSVAQQQLTEIGKCLTRHARLIVMDEPTAALTDRETDALFALIGKLKAQGVAFVYVSHRLEELPRIADRITVLRDGKTVETRAAAALPQDELIRLMVGRRSTIIPRTAAGRGRRPGSCSRCATSPRMGPLPCTTSRSRCGPAK